MEIFEVYKLHAFITLAQGLDEEKLRKVRNKIQRLLKAAGIEVVSIDVSTTY